MVKLVLSSWEIIKLDKASSSVWIKSLSLINSKEINPSLLHKDLNVFTIWLILVMKNSKMLSILGLKILSSVMVLTSQLVLHMVRSATELWLLRVSWLRNLELWVEVVNLEQEGWITSSFKSFLMIKSKNANIKWTLLDSKFKRSRRNGLNLKNTKRKTPGGFKTIKSKIKKQRSSSLNLSRVSLNLNSD